jgi:hypothetical protein
MYNYREHESSYTGKPQGLSRTRILAERAGMEGSLGKGRVGREQVHEFQAGFGQVPLRGLGCHLAPAVSVSPVL